MHITELFILRVAIKVKILRTSFHADAILINRKEPTNVMWSVNRKIYYESNEH